MSEQLNTGGEKVSVSDVEFTSEDGWVKYRLVYDNGTKSQPVDANFETNSPNAERKFKFIREQNVGKPRE